MALPEGEVKRRELLGEIDAELQMLERVRVERERQRWRHVWASMMIARDVDTFIALCAGEAVPAHRIDQDRKAVLDSWPER